MAYCKLFVSFILKNYAQIILFTLCNLIPNPKFFLQKQLQTIPFSQFHSIGISRQQIHPPPTPCQTPPKKQDNFAHISPFVRKSRPPGPSAVYHPTRPTSRRQCRRRRSCGFTLNVQCPAIPKFSPMASLVWGVDRLTSTFS